MSARYAKVLVAVASLATAFAPDFAGAQTFEQNQQKYNQNGGRPLNMGPAPRQNYGGHPNYGHNGYQNHGPNGYHGRPQYGGGGHYYGGGGGGYYGGGGQGFNPALGIMMGVAGAALAAGAAGAAADCIRYQPVYDDWGNYLGRQQVNVC